MSIFNFNNPICTDKIQSERLLALGLKKETADAIIPIKFNPEKWPILVPQDFWISDDPFYRNTREGSIPAWSLERLLCMLPDDAPKIFWILDGASITIDLENDCNTFFPHKGDIYKSIVNCIEWLIKKGYFNKEYLV